MEALGADLTWSVDDTRIFAKELKKDLWIYTFELIWKISSEYVNEIWAW